MTFSVWIELRSIRTMEWLRNFEAIVWIHRQTTETIRTIEGYPRNLSLKSAIVFGLFAKHGQKFLFRSQKHRWRPRASTVWGDWDDYTVYGNRQSSRIFLKRQTGAIGKMPKTYGNHACLDRRYRCSGDPLYQTRVIYLGSCNLVTGRSFFRHTFRFGYSGCNTKKLVKILLQITGKVLSSILCKPN